MNTRVVVAILLGLIAFACAESCVRNLYANDPYYSAFSLKDGFAGYMAKNYRPYNRDSAITYSVYYPNMITLSPQGGDRAAFYDLGPNSLFGTRYNVSLIVGNPAYAGIHVNAQGQIVYATSDIYNPDDRQAFQPFPSDVTSSLQNFGSGLAASFYPQVGHLYLINTYSSQYGETYLTKLIVLAVSADNTTITLRWDVIDSNLEATRNKVNCWISIDTSAAKSGYPDGENSSGYYYNVQAIGVAISVILPVLFVMIVLLGVFVLILFKNMKKFSSYYSTPTPTPMPNMDEKKPLIQK